MTATIGTIERNAEIVASRVRVHLIERSGRVDGWRGSFVLDLGADPDAGDWVTQIKPDPNDPGCKLTLADGRTGMFHVKRHTRRGAFLHVEFVGSGPLVIPS